MKIIIQNTYPQSPHFETELEIALDYIKGGHDVYFLPGIANFKTCYANPLNRKLIVHTTDSFYKNGINLLKKSSNAKHQIHVLEYPKVESLDIPIPDFKDLKELKKFTYKGFDLGLAVVSSLISYKRDHQLKVEEHKELIRNAIHTAAFVYDSGKILFEEIKPDKVLLFNGRFVENRPFMRLCEEAQIPFMTHERGGQLSKYLLRENSIPHSIEAAKKEINELWANGGEEKEKIGRRFYEDRRNKVVQGWYSFTTSQIQGQLPNGFDQKKYRNIVIFNSSMDEYEGIAGYSNPLYKDDNDGIEQICKSLLENANYKVFLRIHPNLKNLNNSQIKHLHALALKYENLVLIHPEEVVDSYALIDNADRVLVFTSTMGTEAAYWGKPVILAGRSFAENLACFYKPENHHELMQYLLDDDLKPLNNQDTLKYGYWVLKMGIDYKYYQPLTITQGVFMNVLVQPSFWLRLINNIKLNLYLLTHSKQQ